MSWHYRVLRHPEGWLGLHQVYCGDAGRPRSYTTRPTGFVADEEEGLGGIVGALEMALKDARERPILDASGITARLDDQTAGEGEIELIEEDQGMSIILGGAVLQAYTEAAAARGTTAGALVNQVLREALARSEP